MTDDTRTDDLRADGARTNDRGAERPTITTRERVAWALLFSLPMGAGISLATGRMARAPPTHPLVFGSGAVAVVVLFALVFGVTAVNQRESPPQNAK